jgi:hypothetical protein
MKTSLALGWLLAATTITTTNAYFPTNQSSHVNFPIPAHLYTNHTEGYRHEFAHFGHFQSVAHGSMAQNLYYIDSPLCRLGFNKSNAHPKLHIDPTTGSFKHVPFFLMVNRGGGCTFVTKARNAQMNGAAGVVIADNTCLCSDADCVKEQDAADTCETREPIMADDGSGGDVTIPALLLYKKDADKIKKTLKGNEPVLAMLGWQEPKTTEFISYSMWMNPLSNQTRDIVKAFSPIAIELGQKALFHPHYMILDGAISNCVGGNHAACGDMCTNYGRYCFASHHIPGAVVVAETLRRICIWKHYGHGRTDGSGTDGIGVEWWNYVTFFDEHCASAEYFADPACLKDAYAHARIQGEDMDICMSDSGSLAQDMANSLLDAELHSQVENGIHFTPTIRVHGHTLNWPTPSAASMLEKICTGFAVGSEPDLCIRCAAATDVVACATNEENKHESNNNKKSSTKNKKRHHILPWFLFMGMLGGCGFWVYKKKQEADANGVPHWTLQDALLGDGA